MRELRRELWPHKITRQEPAGDNKIEDWLIESVGEFTVKWHVVYFHHKTDYYFLKESDALLFSLRWL